MIQWLMPLIIWSPYLFLNLFSQKLNTAPLLYVSSHISNPDWALYIPNRQTYLFTVLFMCTGILTTAVKIKKPKIIALYSVLFLTLCGQLLGYIHITSRAPGSPIAFLINCRY